ncbi:hypothetical protein GCM10027275_30740 [Rhabdobacter roseus]|uniref:Uncharacterized protein n=1 Tax=Rhabdobacter roseus TaxID=1655419 RepID=A0A840TUT8_9BACT|nr:hypothetical protein [Rhabdobacter roseus]MBB5285033.1 hypothetical protein [Rhabdobacter roseus]
MSQSIKDTILQILGAAKGVFETTFSTDMDIMSPEAKQIMSNPEDKKKYIEAIESLRDTSGQEKTIELSTGKITLVS